MRPSQTRGSNRDAHRSLPFVLRARRLAGGTMVGLAIGMLIASLLAVAMAPLLMADSYSWVDNTVSESGAQGVPGAWLFGWGVLGTAAAVLTMTTITLRRSEADPERIFTNELARFPGMESLPESRLEPVRVRSYRPFVSARVSGSNWVMIGEAAVLVDPLTSIGVTAAMRHASEAARLIANGASSEARRRRSLDEFDRRTRAMALLYNIGVDELMYQPSLRRARGIRSAARTYVVLGYGANSLYTRLRPTTTARARLLDVVIALFRLWVRAWLTMAPRSGSPPNDGPPRPRPAYPEGASVG